MSLLCLLGTAWAAPGVLPFQGRDRTFTLHLPPGEAAGRPLVVALHGGGGDADGLDRVAGGQLTREAARRRWALVFPDGVEKGWNDGRPLGSRRDRRRAGVDDVGFLSALVEHLVRTHGLDARRVYFTGMSNGGFMSQRFALDRAEQVAAIGVVVANVAEAWADRRPARPVPAMFLLGTEDPLIPYGGGEVRVLGTGRGQVRSAAATAAHWARLDGCPAEATHANLPDRAPRDDTSVAIDRHGPCAEGAAVELWTVRGGGHTWPLGQQYLPRAVIGRVSREVDGAAVLFDFFARFSR
ncbi:MAG: esterase [Myxococcales bacterium]|nr:esterase [Myxococcales bacterium]